MSMARPFIVCASAAYGALEKMKKMDVTTWNAFRSRIKSLDEDKLPREYAKMTALSHFYGGHDMLMDDDEAAAWTEADIELSVSRVRGLASNSKHLPDVVYQISVANVGLMQIQCVDVLEDCCTDDLQRHLDRGWRLLAVCPPNDTRRPSYIIGHFEKEPHR